MDKAKCGLATRANPGRVASNSLKYNVNCTIQIFFLVNVLIAEDNVHHQFFFRHQSHLNGVIYKQTGDLVVFLFFR